MSLLVEIAEKAHVSVEGVLRVLTREPVSDAVKERVLAVLDDLGPEETRVLQRFALAAVHDVLSRPDATAEAADSEPAEPSEPSEESRPLLAAAEPAPAAPPPAATADPAHLVQLRSVLEELAGAVRDLRQETDTERRERVDDLAVLIELISTGWQGLDRRLGRLERQLERLEARRPQPSSPPPPAWPAEEQPPPPVAEQRPPAAAAATAAEVPPPAEAARGERDRLPLVAALGLVVLVIGTLAGLQVAVGDSDTAGVSPPAAGILETAEQPATTEKARPTTESAPTTAPPSTAAPPTTRRSTAPTTSAVLGTTTAPKDTTPAQTEVPKQAPAPATTTAAEARSAGFQPTRNWAWAPVAGADYYTVRFLRGDTNLYRTSTEQSRLTLPDSVVFLPGSYRWIVRPGFGPRSANRLGAPVVDSTFSVE